MSCNRSLKTRRPNETVASYLGPQLRDGRRGTGSGRVEERQRSARNPIDFVDAMCETGETRAEIIKNVDKKVLAQ